MKEEGKKCLSVNIPEDLYYMFAKVCVNLHITKTEGITRYLRYLKRRIGKGKCKKVSYEDIESQFNLDE